MPTKQRSAWSYFILPGLALIAAVGYAGVTGGLTAAWTVALLSILEVSLSFDNAVINAKVLGGWNKAWRRLFIYVGIFVAVFLVRFGLPILIVSATSGIDYGTVIDMARNHPAQYAAALSSKEHMIQAFGGAFLLLLALEFFLDQEKDEHWIAPLEKLLGKLGNITMAESALTLAAIAIVGLFVPGAERMEYLAAGIVGILTFSFVKTLGTMLGGDGKVIAAGVGGFLFLEVLDASFSLDGVIGAFALTNNIVYIMLGLGVGALAVRELTVLAVDRGTLTQFPHLEFGAFWAIGALAGMMVLGPVVAFPEIVKGLSGALFIGSSFATSLYANRRALADAIDLPEAA